MGSTPAECKDNEIMNTQQQIIIVLGVRRSGTSAITKGLETMGVSLVRPTETPFNQFNQKGYWEDLEVHHFNMQLMRALEPLENRRRSILPLSEKETDFLCEQEFLKRGSMLLLSKFSFPARPLGLKDPRFSLLLPFWKRVFKACKIKASFVIAVREPWSAVASMREFAKGQGETDSQDKKFLWSWISFLLSSLKATEGEERILVDYEALLAQPIHQLQRIANTFQFSLQRQLAEDYSANFIDATLCHFSSDRSNNDRDNRPFDLDQALALEMYQELFLIARDRFPFQQLQPFLQKWGRAFKPIEELLLELEKKELRILKS